MKYIKRNASSELDNQGFTLIELAVVLVIVGLVAGGIMIGSSLVDSARIRTAYKQVEDYKTAVYGFKMKYGKLPGDMNNAINFFPTCPEIIGNPCNGNGDGYIDWTGGPKPADRRERYRAFSHLTLSGFIDDPIYSWPGAGGYTFDGTGCPLSTLSGAACFEFQGRGLYLGSGGFLNNSAVSVEDAYKLDQKFDDGIPDKGKIRAFWGSDTWPSCRSSPGAGNNATWWLTTGTKPVCTMRFDF